MCLLSEPTHTKTFQFVTIKEAATRAPPSSRRMVGHEHAIGITGPKICLGCGPGLQVDDGDST
jgi:hypothetical protein